MKQYPMQTSPPEKKSPGGKKGGRIAGEIMSRWRIRGLCFSVPSEMKRILVALLTTIAVLLVALLILLVAGRDVIFTTTDKTPQDTSIPELPVETGEYIATSGSHPFATGREGDVTLPFSEACIVLDKKLINSTRAVLVDLSRGEVIASRKGDERMYPASLTKLMTLIVVVENLAETSSLSDEVTVSEEVYRAMRNAGASGAGLEAGETLTVKSMLYLLILRSDGIAACELARYTAGTEEAFVTLMNHKAASMGLTNTHFANPTGLQDEGNYSTCRDMAAILAYAMDIALCREILTAEKYDAPCTSQGKAFTYFLYNNLLLSMLTEKYPGERPKTVQVIAGKTGYAGGESGYCLATYAVTSDGRAYLCVTSQSESYLNCIQDYITLYDKYVKATS